MKSRKDFKDKLKAKYSEMKKPISVKEFQESMEKEGFIFDKSTNVLTGI